MTSGASRAVSVRVLLARVAEEVIAASEGVSATPGRDRRWVTADADRLIEGVLVVRDRDGLVDVELHLVADWPPQPLAALAADLRRRLRRSTARAGLSDQIGEVDVTIHDVRGPGEAA